MKSLVHIKGLFLLAGLVALCAVSVQGLAAAGPGGFAMPPASVAVLKLKSQPVALEEVLPGRVVPFQVAEIRPQVTGIITARLFSEGAMVKEGDQLYQIDPATYQAAVGRAKADLARVEASLQALRVKVARFKELARAEAVSRQELEDLTVRLSEEEANQAVAKAALETANINLNYTRIHAPISGRIGKSDVTKGALVTMNQPAALSRVTQLDPVYVDVMVSGEPLNRLREALRAGKDSPVVQLLLDKDRPYGQAGQLKFLDVSMDEATGSVLLRATFPNAGQELLPGMFVHVKVNVQTISAMLVPQRAVMHNADGTASVWVVDTAAKKVQPLVIKTDKAMGDQWLVREGIPEDATIVMEGFQRLFPGAEVQPEPWTASPANGTPKAGQH